MTSTSSKLDLLNELTRQRKADSLPGHACLHDFHDGAYDKHDYLSPWSLSAHNENADILIFMQDWSSQESLSGTFDCDAATIGYTPTLPSNKNLIDLLSKHFNKSLSEIYVTNLFLFIKPGNMSSTIPLRDMMYCANKYALPLIDIIQPSLVIALGSLTYNSIRRSLNEAPIPLKESLDHPLIRNSSLIYGLSHTGGLGMANAGGYAALDEQWSKLSKLYRNSKK